MIRAVPSILIALALGLPVAAADAEYVDVSGSAGILPYTVADGMGSGIAAADFDDDGDVDLFLPNGPDVADQLYRNLGDGTFEEIASAAGVASLASSRVALWLDIDGDGLLDLLVAGDCYFENTATCLESSTLRLYRQVSDATFQDVAVAAGFTDDLIEDDDSQRTGMAAGDVNNDGWIDLLLGLWEGEARLFVNDGDGTFTEDTAVGPGGSATTHWQQMMFDVDDDGWLDVYQAIDWGENRLWINQHDGTFLDQAAAANADNSMNDMGMTVGDYDNDGDFDIYVTNIEGGGGYNILLRNDSVSSLSFTEYARQLNVDNGGWGWGTTFLDADNDGWLDIAATNGWTTGSFENDISKLFLNSGTVPVSYSLASGSGFDDTRWGSSLVALDYDRDGDLDLVQTCNATTAVDSSFHLLQNQLMDQPAGHNYLVIKPRMEGPNRRAIGAVVRVTAGTLQMMRPITAGTSFLGQEPAEAFFGLGSATSADSVTIDWPGGGQTQLSSVAANQVLTVTAPLDSDGDGTPDASDPDDDNDGILDESDCAPLDDTAWQLPGAVGDLSLLHSGGLGGTTTLAWGAPAVPGGSLLHYDAIVSPQAGDFDGAASCIETDDGSDETAEDSTPPAAGGLRFFLIRAGNACGDGELGPDWLGQPRSARDCS